MMPRLIYQPRGEANKYNPAMGSGSLKRRYMERIEAGRLRASRSAANFVRGERRASGTYQSVRCRSKSSTRKL
jgi:hypothetical protein